MRRLQFFAAFFLLLFLLEISLLLEPVDRQIIRPFSSGVAFAAAGVLRFIGEHVQTSGTMILGKCLAIDIRNGCNGVEVMMFVVAAVIAFPAKWQQRLVASIVGAVLLQVANLIRVVTLYVIGCHDPAWFETVHLAIWQSLMFGAAVAYFILWSRRARPVHAP